MKQLSSLVGKITPQDSDLKPDSDKGSGEPDYVKEIRAMEKTQWEVDRDSRSTSYLSKVMPPAFKATDVSRLPQPQLSRLLKWRFSDGRGLLLHGPTGTCKTRCLWVLLARLIEKEHFKVLYYTSDRLSRELGDSYMDHSHGRLFTKLATRKILVIDDLGKEKPTARWEEDLFSLIRERCDYLKPTFITTNFVGDGLIGRYKDREMAVPLVRRLREFCDSVAFGGNKE